MTTTAPEEVQYDLGNFGDLMSGPSGAYAKIYGYIDTETLTTGVFSAMIGYPINEGSSPQSSMTSAEITETGQLRTLNFFNFWNNKSKTYLNGLADDFTNVSNVMPYDSAKNDRIYYGNISITYILILAFTFLGSPDGVRTTPSINIFTPKSNRASFCEATDNLRYFIKQCRGLGNAPVYPGNVKASLFLQQWNTGYLLNFCNQEFANFCLSENLETTDQKCLSSFRTKLANSTTALNWCGCFVPLTDFMIKSLGNVSNKKACDSLCFREDSIKLYYVPGTDPGDESIINCNSQICIIDNNTINSVNSKANISFNQICKCTGGEACLCFIETSIPGLLDNVSGTDGVGMTSSVSYNQDCTNSLCFTIDPETGVENEVRCNPVDAARTGDTFQKTSPGKTTIEDYKKIDSTFWVFFIFLMLVLLMYQFSYLEIKLS